MRRWSPYHPLVTRLMDLTGHLVDGTERQPKLSTYLCHLALEAEKQQLEDTLMTYVRTWTIELVRPG